MTAKMGAVVIRGGELKKAPFEKPHQDTRAGNSGRGGGCLLGTRYTPFPQGFRQTKRGGWKKEG